MLELVRHGLRQREAAAGGRGEERRRAGGGDPGGGAAGAAAPRAGRGAGCVWGGSPEHGSARGGGEGRSRGAEAVGGRGAPAPSSSSAPLRPAARSRHLCCPPPPARPGGCPCGGGPGLPLRAQRGSAARSAPDCCCWASPPPQPRLGVRSDRDIGKGGVPHRLLWGLGARQ